MDIYRYLKQDHETVNQMMEKMPSVPAAKRGQAFDNIKKELTLHAESEEQTFYEAVKKAARTKSAEEKVEHANEEHDEIREYLDKLSAMNYKTEEWLMCFGEFKHAVTHHVEEEESEMFEKAKRYLSPEQAKSLVAEMDALKEEMEATLEKKAA